MQPLPVSPLLGQMMDQPLLISDIIEFADRHFGSTEVVSRRIEGDLHRYTYHDCHTRARQLANALDRLGVQMGDRAATLAWNGYRHMEVYYAVSGSGAVLHTVNPRLAVDQLAYIVNHAEDSCLFFDLTFLPLVEQLAPLCNTVRHYILMCDPGHMPSETAIPGLLCYETLLAAESDDYRWPQFDERSACGLCYTSGTTGNPKGVLYSHRSNMLHALASGLPNGLNVSSQDTILPMVPMFHVNAWGLPYSAPMSGAKLVLPGAAMDGASLCGLIMSERVTFAAGVPTIWSSILNHAQEHKYAFPALKRTVIGGSACPPSMMNTLMDDFGVEVMHGWGMTEMSPLGTQSKLQAKHLSLPDAEQRQIRRKQGHAIFGVDLKIVDDSDKELPWDGRAVGHLMTRGPWIVSSYYGKEDVPVLRDGWFPTGDMATIDPDGYMQITDRSKDVIKSGGEWISSIDLENIAISHPAIMQAVCIALPHPKWDERPFLVVVLRPGMACTREDLLAFYQGKVPKWCIPDDVAFVDELPISGTGKVLKNRVRDQFKSHHLPTT